MRLAALALALLVLAGCSDPNVVSVKGTATRGGQPLKNLRITFNPDKGAASIADTDDQGHFELVCSKDVKGAVLGNHKVTAMLMPRDSKQEMDIASGKLKLHPDQKLINEKYGTLDVTPMTVEITKAEANLELKFD